MNFKGIEICCPYCQGELELSTNNDQLCCQTCQHDYPIILDIPDLRIFPDPYIDIEADRAKALKVAAQYDDTDFEGLIDFYYGTTSVVPPHHARLYKRGLLAAEARATAALASWDNMLERDAQPATASLLEIGCGTAPMLVAAAAKAERLIGVDIAFRWLAVAKKRLEEAGLDIPLICACAEALPFPDSSFDCVIADSVIEHLQDQRQALVECNRCMQPGGYLYLATPNRFSLGPDPHTGVWAGGFLPDSWTAWVVKRQGGIPPKRHLLTASSLSHVVSLADFKKSKVALPGISKGQRNHFGAGMRLLIDIYDISRRLPVSRDVLRWIGPLLYAVCQKAPGSSQPQKASAKLETNMLTH